MERPVLAVAFRRCLALATTFVLLPGGVGAQLMPLQDDPYWGAKLRITPAVGWAPGVTRDETWITAVPGQPVAAIRAVDMELDGGPMASLTFEYAFKGPFSVLLGGTYLNRDVAKFTTHLKNDGQNNGQGGVGHEDELRTAFTGSSSILVKAGVSMQLRERESELMLRRLNASVFVAPFYMMETPEELEGITGTDLFDDSNSFGVNFGAVGELPFGHDKYAFQLAFEDFLTFWDSGALARLPEFRLGVPTDVDVDATHQWVIRAGLSFRFR